MIVLFRGRIGNHLFFCCCCCYTAYECIWQRTAWDWNHCDISNGLICRGRTSQFRRVPWINAIDSNCCCRARQPNTFDATPVYVEVPHLKSMLRAFKYMWRWNVSNCLWIFLSFKKMVILVSLSSWHGNQQLLVLIIKDKAAFMSHSLSRCSCVWIAISSSFRTHKKKYKKQIANGPGR